MRALLIVNPHATSTTERRRDLLAHALAGELSLKVARTESRGHAAHLAAAAADSGVDVVVVHGGDGTVNEVANGLMYRGVRPDVPMLAVVPGGSTNVFARAMGVDPDPTVATEQILEALAAQRVRTVSLGRADERYFTFNAGLGLDAETVRAVEKRRAAGRTITNAMHVRDAILQFFRAHRRTPRMSLELPGRDRIDDAHLVFVSNVDPWTYLGNVPIRTNPGTSPTTGLGVFALTSMSLPHGLQAATAIVSGRTSGGKHVVRTDDVPWATVRCREPVAFQMDGDYLGERSEVKFTSVPRALRLVV
ncbi:MAG TPA: diacylglycerol kinase family protein [Nakamurella multipartita]|jgi:diacylglycerol kinase family enzyme|nr:diacylglycerol kinase family protein [Nakamurella multipartita]